MPKRSSVSLPLISLLPHLQLTRHSIHFLFKETNKHTNKSAKTKHLSTWILIWCCIEYHGRYKLWRSRVSNIICVVFFYQYTHVCFKKSHPQCAHNWQNLSFISHLLWVLLVSKFEAWSCKKNSLWSTRVCMLFSQAQHPCFFWILLTITTQLADQ